VTCQFLPFIQYSDGSLKISPLVDKTNRLSLNGRGLLDFQMELDFASKPPNRLSQPGFFSLLID